MNEELKSALTELRDKYFPKEINYLQAHITLFHQLPESCELRIRKLLSDQAVLPVELNEPVFLGFGFGVKVSSPELNHLYKNLMNECSGYLNRQDAAQKNLHVTIQNKVEAARAKENFSEFKEQWGPMKGKILGLEFYNYLKGPWEKRSEIQFRRI